MGLHHLAIILPLVGPLAHARADVTTTNKMLKRTNGVRNLQILDDTTTDDTTNVITTTDTTPEPESEPTITAPIYTAEECDGWITSLVSADVDSSNGLSESEYSSFLSNIEDPPYIAEYFKAYDGFDNLPWVFRVVHKSLACHCEKLGLGEECCEGDNAEVLLNGLSDGNNDDATTSEASSRGIEEEIYKDLFCQQIAYLLTRSIPSPAPTAGPSGSPTDSPSGSPTDPPSGIPTDSPIGAPTAGPSGSPTDSPSGSPTDPPSGIPTDSPIGIPTDSPIGSPTDSPSGSSTDPPSGSPTKSPSIAPSLSPVTSSPTVSPASPSGEPTVSVGPTGTMRPTPSRPTIPLESTSASSGSIMPTVNMERDSMAIMEVDPSGASDSGGLSTGGIVGIIMLILVLLILVLALVAHRRRVNEQEQLRKFAGEQAPESDLEDPIAAPEEPEMEPEMAPPPQPAPDMDGPGNEPDEDDESSVPSVWSESQDDEDVTSIHELDEDGEDGKGVTAGSALAAMGAASTVAARISSNTEVV
eukprot:CAMPEP_0196162014 /NCGR_PEP_ID=MMETSP0910-20130528/47619_1 /TAXON_ID=49265 /ORGANISM="Thalassiosira rotula, Strain GSO102" /LENGTH=527 /DNA_ID=CAMNT_0041426959 /DNA_START=222 /DNA_END=1806 /DNA_ORIENTATION=-